MTLEENLVNYFLGSCHSVTEAIAEEFGTTQDEILAILNEEEVYLCESCGWWWELGEMYDTETCQECHDDD